MIKLEQPIVISDVSLLTELMQRNTPYILLAMTSIDYFAHPLICTSNVRKLNWIGNQKSLNNLQLLPFILCWLSWWDVTRHTPYWLWRPLTMYISPWSTRKKIRFLSCSPWFRSSVDWQKQYERIKLNWLSIKLEWPVVIAILSLLTELMQCNMPCHITYWL